MMYGVLYNCAGFLYTYSKADKKNPMNTTFYRPRPIWAAIIGLMLITLACGLVDNFAPVTTPVQMPAELVATQAVTVASPTPPLPTVAIATEVDSQITAEVQEYYRRGYLPYQNGDLTSLPDFSKSQVSATDVYDFTRTGAESQDFALWADIKLNTVGSPAYPNYTGCGFFYRVQSNSQGYTAILTNAAVRMGAYSIDLGKSELFGTLSGTGEVDVPNKTKAHFALTVNQNHAYVLVDGNLISTYNLYTTRLQGTGDLYYANVSNSGVGYWTTCEMTNIKLWESRP